MSLWAHQPRDPYLVRNFGPSKAQWTEGASTTVTQLLDLDHTLSLAIRTTNRPPHTKGGESILEVDNISVFS